MNLYTYSLIADVMREHVNSARPHAPVVPDRISPRQPGMQQARRLTALTLRRLADRVEPCPPPAPTPTG